jgi:HK97 family phage major capsid protein
MPGTKLEELASELQGLHTEMQAIKTEAGPEYDLDKVESVAGALVEKASYISEKMQRMDAIGIDIEALTKAGVAQEEGLKRHGDTLIALNNSPIGRPDMGGGQLGGENSRLHLAKAYLESPAYKAFGGNYAPTEEFNVGLKDIFANATIDGSAGHLVGWPSETTRTGIMVDYPTRPLQVLDLMPMMNTTQSSVKYVEETVFDNQAIETGQSLGVGTGPADGVLQESQLRVEEKNIPVQSVGTIMAMTQEQIQDEAMAYGYLNDRLPFMVMQRIDGQVLVGDGAGNNLMGLINATGIGTQARGSDNGYDAVFKAMIKVMYTGFANPTAIVMSPLAWQRLALDRGNDQYFAGGPIDARAMRAWGLPVVISNVLPADKAIVGDFMRYCILFDRQMVQVDISDSHQDYFSRRQLAIRAVARVAFVTLRPSAFCEVTGL